MLIYAFGISIDIHECQGEIKSIGVFSLAEKCDMSNSTVGCENDQGSSILKKSCCSNSQFYLQNDVVGETLQSSQIQEYKTSADLVDSYYAISIAHSSEQSNNFLVLCIPDVVKDLNALHQTYLI